MKLPVTGCRRVISLGPDESGSTDAGQMCSRLFTVLPGPEQSGPEAAGLQRRAALPQPFHRQPVPTRHQREPVSPTPRRRPPPPRTVTRCRNEARCGSRLDSSDPGVSHCQNADEPSPPPFSSLHHCVCRIETFTMIISYIRLVSSPRGWKPVMSRFSLSSSHSL